MDWKVGNALSRDVERQQLNRILAEIRLGMDAITKTNSVSNTKDVRDLVGKMVDNNSEQGIRVTYDLAKKVLDFIVSDFTITLAGDVTGSGEVNSLHSVTINTELDPSKIGVGEAPIDNFYYWRRNADWSPVNPALISFADLKGTGFPAQHQEDSDSIYELRTFEVEPGELVVTNPAGELGNPLFGLADTAVVPDIYGSLTERPVFEVDQKGRLISATKLTVVYEYTQASPSDTWTINHNLGFIPSVELFTPGGAEFDALVQHISVNQCIVYLAAAYAGSARLN